jgi:hypothetical protein
MLALDAAATNFYSPYGTGNKTYNNVIVSGSHYFEIDGIASYRTTYWYLNGTLKETDTSGLFAVDPDITLSITASATVVGKVYNGATLVETHTWNLTIDVTGPTTPGTPDLDSADDTGYSSTDNITKNTTGLTFSWSASSDSGSGLAGYEWKLDSGAWSALITGTSVSISAGEGGHTFYVRAKDNANNYSGSSSLAFTVDTTAPAAPTLVSPSNGSSTTDHTPTFTWNSVSGAYRYRLVVDDKDIIGTGDQDLLTTSTSFTPTSDMQEDTWYWKVLAEDAAGNQSAWSAEWSVNVVAPETVSTPSTPSGSSTGDVGQSLSYSTGGASSSYGHSVQYQFDWGDGTTSPWSSSTSVSHSWSSAGTYTITARARCASDTSVVSSWSGGKSVTISARVTGLSWRNGTSSGAGTVTTIEAGQSVYVRADAVGMNGQTVNVDIYEYDPLANDYITTVSVTIGSSGYGTTSWTARWVDDGIGGGWPEYILRASGVSDSAQMTVTDTTGPSAPALSNPADGSTQTSSSVSFTWSSSTDSAYGSGFKNYTLQVDDNSDFSSPVINHTGLTSLSSTESLPSDGTYYWRVLAYDNLGMGLCS